MAGNLRYAQQLSVTEQVVHGVEFDFFNNSYQVNRYGEATSTIRYVELDSEVEFHEINGLSENMVKFNFYGGVNESGEVILNNVNTEAKVIIKPSGYVQLD